jgi:diaminohydroxyphosphoribosylaminopyrimidine deaminase/5-amino-6-(5-phosphoribosylamino)uracil reductase
VPPLVKERPRVTLKAAITLDGHTAARNGDSKWISGEVARKAAHRLRAEVDAVLVGVGTVLRDDPELTVRHVRGKSPLRVVLDSRLRTPAESRVVQAGPGLRTLILHGPKARLGKRRALAAAGVALLGLGVDRHGRLRLDAVLRALHELGVEELLVEGGPTVHGAFLDAGVVDRVWIALAPALLGDARALPLAAGHARERIADALPLRFTRERRLGPDLLIEGSLSPAEATPRGSRRAREGRTR